MLLPIVFSNHCNLDCAYCCITNKNTSPVLSLEKAIAHIEKNKSLYGEENLEIESKLKNKLTFITYITLN